MIGSGRLHNSGFGRCIEVRRVKIIFSSNADEREQRISAGKGECRSHSLRRGDIGNGTHGPFRGDPFAGRMSKDSCEAKKPGIFVDCGGLDCRDLMPASCFGGARHTLDGSIAMRVLRELPRNVPVHIGPCSRPNSIGAADILRLEFVG